MGDYRYSYQGQEKEELTGQISFELREYDPQLLRFQNPDPYGQYISPYLAMGNNPVNMIDPDGGWAGEYDILNGVRTKISDLGDEQGVDFNHYLDGEHEGETEITYKGFSAWMKSSEFVRGYTKRDDDVDFATITNEFLEGTGPEKSIFENHEMVEDMKMSYAADMARTDYVDKGAESKIGGHTGFGGNFTIFRAGVNMTEQMIGSASYSVYPLGKDYAMIMLFDSKSRTSLYYHLPFVQNYTRGSVFKSLNPVKYDNRKTNTYQTYFWIESMKTMKKRIEQYEIENGTID